MNSRQLIRAIVIVTVVATLGVIFLPLGVAEAITYSAIGIGLGRFIEEIRN